MTKYYCIARSQADHLRSELHKYDIADYLNAMLLLIRSNNEITVENLIKFFLKAHLTGEYLKEDHEYNEKTDCTIDDIIKDLKINVGVLIDNLINSEVLTKLTIVDEIRARDIFIPVKLNKLEEAKLIADQNKKLLGENPLNTNIYVSIVDSHKLIAELDIISNFVIYDSIRNEYPTSTFTSTEIAFKIAFHVCKDKNIPMHLIANNERVQIKRDLIPSFMEHCRVLIKNQLTKGGHLEESEHKFKIINMSRFVQAIENRHLPERRKMNKSRKITPKKDSIKAKGIPPSNDRLDIQKENKDNTQSANTNVNFQQLSSTTTTFTRQSATSYALNNNNTANIDVNAKNFNQNANLSEEQDKDFQATEYQQIDAYLKLVVRFNEAIKNLDALQSELQPSHCEELAAKHPLNINLILDDNKNVSLPADSATPALNQDSESMDVNQTVSKRKAIDITNSETEQGNDAKTEKKEISSKRKIAKTHNNNILPSETSVGNSTIAQDLLPEHHLNANSAQEDYAEYAIQINEYLNLCSNYNAAVNNLISFQSSLSPSQQTQLKANYPFDDLTQLRDPAIDDLLLMRSQEVNRIETSHDEALTAMAVDSPTKDTVIKQPTNITSDKELSATQIRFIDKEWSQLLSEIKALPSSITKETKSRIQARYNLANNKEINDPPSVLKFFKTGKKQSKDKNLPGVESWPLPVVTDIQNVFKKKVKTKDGKNDLILGQYGSWVGLPYRAEPVAGQYTFKRHRLYHIRTTREEFLRDYYLPALNSSDPVITAKILLVLFSHLVKEYFLLPAPLSISNCNSSPSTTPLFTFIQYELSKLGFPLPSRGVREHMGRLLHRAIKQFDPNELEKMRIHDKFTLTNDVKYAIHKKLPDENSSTEQTQDNIKADHKEKPTESEKQSQELPTSGEKPVKKIWLKKQYPAAKDETITSLEGYTIYDEDIDIYDADTNYLVASFRTNVIDKETIDGINKYAFVITRHELNSQGAKSSEDRKHENDQRKKRESKSKTSNAAESAPLEQKEAKTNSRNRKTLPLGIFGLSSHAVPRVSNGLLKHNYPNEIITYISKALVAGESVYKCVTPDEYEYVRAQTPKEFLVFPDTEVTSMVELNFDKQTVTHRDTNDYPGKSYSILAYFYGSNDRRYEGGETVFPEYRFGLDGTQGSVAICDFEQLHGNAPIKFLDKRDFLPIKAQRQDYLNCRRMSMISFTKGDLFTRTEKMGSEDSDAESDFSEQSILKEMENPAQRNFNPASMFKSMFDMALSKLSPEEKDAINDKELIAQALLEARENGSKDQTLTGIKRKT